MCREVRAYKMTEAKLESTDVQGFPIISPDAAKVVLGYIGRTEIRYVLRAPIQFSVFGSVLI